ncbi:MAG: hypothetical protein SFW66_03815 [Gammaproteobacteria bacterium]|nr:hypothetical protein [Gammaproteobacteria bacterium]
MSTSRYGLLVARQNNRGMYDRRNIMSSPILPRLFRLDTVELVTHNNQLQLGLNLLELLCFRIARKQVLINGKDVVRHQGSTELIGTTSKKETALKLSNSWKDRNAVLVINPKILQKTLIDVEATVKHVGSAFFTKIREDEHSLTLLPIFTIKEIDLIHHQSTIANPFYIEPTADVMNDLEAILELQIKFFEQLYLEGKRMSSSERQAALNIVINQIADFYQKNLSNNNPFHMTAAQYQMRHGTDLSHQQLSRYPTTTTILEILTTDGDKLFMENKYYPIGDQIIRDEIEKSNEENGYGGCRHSYTYE